MSKNDGFPYLEEDEIFDFPDPLSSPKNFPACQGGNLSPGMLLSAYSQGFFPWSNSDDYIHWWSPDPRCIIFPGEVHISASMARFMKKSELKFFINRDFEKVINLAASVVRKGEEGTWITPNMIEAYVDLHKRGYAHSFEIYEDEELVGGLYGIAFEKVFFGESMFSLRPNASKIAFIFLNKYAEEQELDFIDCQMPTKHLLSLGAEVVSRERYITLLKKAYK